MKSAFPNFVTISLAPVVTLCERRVIFGHSSQARSSSIDYDNPHSLPFKKTNLQYENKFLEASLKHWQISQFYIGISGSLPPALL